MAALEREQEEAGIDEWTPTTSWDGGAMDVDWTLYTLMEPLPPRTPREPGDAREPEEAPEHREPECRDAGEPGDSRPSGPGNFPKR